MMLPLALALALATTADAPRALTLEEALQTATQNQPTLRQAHAQTGAAEARADEALAPNLPQVNLTASYQRATKNFTARPGTLPNGQQSGGGVSLSSADYFSAGVTATQTIWDFQQTWGRYQAAKATARAQTYTEESDLVTVALNVRTAYFTARAQRDLIDVAQSALKNQQAHLDQTQGFVQVGTQPEIALAQSKANVANARVQLITAQNNYSTAKARLNQAMGVEGPTDFEVTDNAVGPVEGEDGPLDALVNAAWSARPEAKAFDQELEAAKLTQKAIRGAYYPSLGASLGATLAGPEPADLVPNLSGQLTLNWNLYAGGLTDAQVREAGWNVVSVQAQRDALHLQVRLDVEQAQLAVRAAKETLSASGDAFAAAQAQLELAEGRYKAGVGNIIELSDAQAALTAAAAQKVSATYSVATARAQLLAALGRP